MKDSILHGIEMYILISLIVSGTITILAASSFSVVQAQTSGTSTTTQGEADIADTVMSYITQAESALATASEDSNLAAKYKKLL